jgi:SAM-dependent methyltransferase
MQTENELGPGYEGIAEYYDYFADNEDLPLYLKYARQQGSPVLDLAAGTGRVSFVLARAGFAVTALENSPSMLAEFRRRQSQMPKDPATLVDVVEGDMRDFSLGRRYSLVIIPGSLGHAMTSEQQISTLKCIRNHMKRDAIFILDLYPGALIPERSSFSEVPVQLPDGRLVVRSGIVSCDMVRQVMSAELTYKESSPAGAGEGRETHVKSHAAVIFNREADLLVRIAGLHVIAELGGFDGKPYEPESSRRILILRK